MRSRLTVGAVYDRPQYSGIKIAGGHRPPLQWIILCLLLSACGRVGDPLPPFIRIPEAVKDLSVSQSGYNLVLTWTNPAKYIDGSAATNLSRVRIRNNGAVMTTSVAGAGKPQSLAIRLGSEMAGERTFSLTVETNQGKLSEISNTVSISPVEVPGRVAALSAIPDQRRIFVKWQKPKEGSEFADAYLVVRTDIPADAETVAETAYEDVRYQAGKMLTYQVTAARRVNGTTVMGVGPESITITAEDKTPPKIPSGVEIQVSDTGAFVTWQPNEETDLAGYRVFRSEHPDGGFKAVTDRILTSNSFFDTSYKSGMHYAVSAVDEFGNQSMMSAPFRAQ